MAATGPDLKLIKGDGTAATKNHGVASGEIPLMDGTGYPAADGSQITNIAGSASVGLEADKTLSGANTYEWLSLAAATTFMELIARDVSQATSSSIVALQLGNSGGYVTSGYTGLVTEDAQNHVALSAHIPLDHVAKSAATVRQIHGSLWKMDNHVWSFQFDIVDTTGSAVRTTVTGSVDLTTELDRIKIFTTGGVENFDGGVASLYTDKST